MFTFKNYNNNLLEHFEKWLHCVRFMLHFLNEKNTHKQATFFVYTNDFLQRSMNSFQQLWMKEEVF